MTQVTDSSEIVADSDSVNIQFANPTTPAQYFHLLRRQVGVMITEVTTQEIILLCE